MAGGSSVAASDIYGTGVRFGIYFQVFGMLLSCIRLKSQGLKLTSAASALAILVSWTILVQRKELSGAEAWMILSLVSLFVLPAASAVSAPKNIVGEGVGLVALLVSQFWFIVAYIWFWASLYKTLPSLDTSDSAWFFVAVNIKHWFRLYMLISGCLMYLPVAITTCAAGAVLVYLSCRAWLKGAAEIRGQTKKQIKAGENVSRALALIGIVIWVFGIAGVEMMIKYNGLEPASDFTYPGQTIPLAIGSVVLIDGIFAIFKEKPEI